MMLKDNEPEAVAQAIREAAEQDDVAAQELREHVAMAVSYTHLDVYKRQWYYLHDSGVMATGWLKLGDTWYYLHGSGAMATGWLTLGEAKYYLDSSGAMVTGERTIDLSLIHI